jgi:hypothetical protein
MTWLTTFRPTRKTSQGTRNDLEALERALLALDDKTPQEFADDEITGIKHAPAPLRGVLHVLVLLPPGARLGGLLILAGLIAFAIWRGVSWAL